MMSDELNRRWQWSELDPLTRTVVAAFSGHIGDESKGDISGDAFVDAMTSTFDVTAEDVTKTAKWTGSAGMRNIIVSKLLYFERPPIAQMTQYLGHLAGGTEATYDLATQAGEQLTQAGGYGAIPALRVLSELAVNSR